MFINPTCNRVHDDDAYGLPAIKYNFSIFVKPIDLF